MSDAAQKPVAPPVQPQAAPPATPAPDGQETPEQSLQRALAAAQNRRVNEAQGICEDVLAAHPDHPGGLALLGSLQGRSGKVDSGIARLERAVALNPNVPTWHANLAAMYRVRNRLDDALAAASNAVRLQPDHAGHRIELGLTQLTRGEDEDALASLLSAIARDPESANAHMATGELLLSRGEFRAGWLEYEWRNKLEQAKGTLPKMVAPAWNGMRLPRGRILLIADQGYGDMIQFCRYIPRVVERAAEVVLGWGPEVVALLDGHPGVAKTYLRWTDVPPHDAYCLLSSLPGIFGTDLDSIPAPIPYLQPKQDKLARWRARLDALSPPGSGRRRVGIAWAGRPTHPNNLRRSLSLDQLAPLLAVEGIDFFTVQRPVPDGDRAFMAAHANLHDVSNDLTDFAETQALIAALDLVTTVDTAVAHLGGAIGQPVWVLVPKPADWRWLQGRTESPWYPTLRLFRQDVPCAWEPVIETMATALRQFATQPAEAGSVPA